MNVKFKPAWWLRNRHLQTIWQQYMRKNPLLPVRRERIELADGDFIDVDRSLQETGPIVIVLHGLEGSINSPYARGLLLAMNKLNWRCAVMHFRGCSGETNRLTRSYHSGDTEDLDAFIKILRCREADIPIAVVGVTIKVYQNH